MMRRQIHMHQMATIARNHAAMPVDVRRAICSTKAVWLAFVKYCGAGDALDLSSMNERIEPLSFEIEAIEQIN